MPSQKKSITEELLKQRGIFNAPRKDYVSVTNLKTPSSKNTTIDFCEVKWSPPNQVKKENKVVIHCVGNSDNYENHFEEYIYLAKKYPGIIIVGFNYRNVLYSTGQPPTQQSAWIDDIIAVISHYKNQHIPLNHILLYGHSLGAAISTIAASKINKLEIKENHSSTSINLINSRSFSTLSIEVICRYLNRQSKALLNGTLYGLVAFAMANLKLAILVTIAMLLLCMLCQKISIQLLRPWVGVLLGVTFGRMDALSAFNSLPKLSKSYIAVKDDWVIPTFASLHYGLGATGANNRLLTADILDGFIRHRAPLSELYDAETKESGQIIFEKDIKNMLRVS